MRHNGNQKRRKRGRDEIEWCVFDVVVVCRCYSGLLLLLDGVLLEYANKNATETPSGW